MATQPHRFFKSFPQEWRLIVLGLTLTTFIALGFQFAFLVTGIQHGGFRMPLHVVLLAWVPLGVLNLLQDFASPENTAPFAKGRKYVLTSFICIGVLGAKVSAYFHYAHQSEKDIRADWAISQLCTTNGDFKADNVEVCLALLPAFNGRLCKLGARPMNKCESQLRHRLNIQETNSSPP